MQPRIDSPDGPLTLEVTVTNTGTGTISYGEQRSSFHLSGDSYVYHS